MHNHLVSITSAEKIISLPDRTGGAKRAAMFYSFFGTCKKNNVNPYEWLKKVLELIPEYPANKIGDLLPQNLKL